MRTSFSVAPDSVWPGDGIATDGELFIFFTSNRVSRNNDSPVRIDLETSLFTSSTIFAGEVLDSASGQPAPVGERGEREGRCLHQQSAGLLARCEDDRSRWGSA